MRKISIVLFMLLFCFTLMPGLSDACTTTLVTKGASTDGSVIVSHSDDDELGDQRMILVPAMDHAPGSKRPVYWSPGAFGSPTVRLVARDRGPGYDTPAEATKILGYIDQVPHTYAYFDANYGVMNEHQLSFGECTDGAKINPKAEPGKRLFYTPELSRVALERCTKAREAIKLMGELIEKYGYYGPGETLLVADTEEGWVMEICGASPEGTGGLWAAKKVPDGEVFVAANEFRIREVDPNDPNMLYAKDLFKIAENNGWWNPKDGKLDWLSTVSNGEYNHPYYSLRRVWRIMSRIAPSAGLKAWVKDGFTKEYPFSIKPDKKLTVRDVMEYHRDHYEGTEFDMTKGIAAGPFGCPYRYYGKYDTARNDVRKPDPNVLGAWERPISVFYSGYIHVIQNRSWLPDEIGGVCWWGPDEPQLTCFVPFYAGITELPEAYMTGTTKKYDRNVAWWAFNFTANWAALKFDYAKKDIFAKQKEIENREFSIQSDIEKKALELYKNDPEEAKRYLTSYCVDNADGVVEEWWRLADELIVKYDDGYVETQDKREEVGYPKWWLKEVGYGKGPVTYKKPSK